MADKQKNFTHLHVHTEFSLLDGACRIDQLFDRVKELGQTAVAITDHGVMYGCVDFYKAAKAAGIKPIIGCEVYVATRSRFDKVNRIDGNNHLVLLCKNETGYKNLIKLVSAGFTEGFYSKPRVDKALLEEHSEGLVCLSACLAGETPQALMAGDYEKAKASALYFNNLFGQDNYYIEIQDHGLQEQQQILPQLIRLSRDTGIPLVATNDSHYLRKEDSKMQSILICIQTGKTISDPDRMEFETDEFYIKSTEEMYDLFAIAPDACENTNKIAKMCNFDFDFSKSHLPAFVAPNGMDNQQFFEQLCSEGLVRRYGDGITDEMRQRLSYEIDVIKRMGFTNYFLIVYDFIHYAKSQDIPVGPGRGSGAGSIAAYCVGITDIDPIRYNLLFERFLNPERVSMPDFDIDFCYERRQEVIDYVNRKYGTDHVAQIITFGTMAARGAIRDVGRVMDMPYAQVDSIAKLVPMELKMTLTKALEVSPDLKALYDTDPQVQELMDTARKIEGMPRHASTHAAGVVITPNPTDEYVPLAANDGVPVTQFNMTTVEELGLLKMDFLGLRTLTVIHDAERMIQRREPNFLMQNISYEDVETYELLSRSETEGVFQLESTGMKQVLLGLHPKNLEDIIALISLYRPGPMDSIPTYLRNRQHPDEVRYKTPQLAHILDVTNGCIVYQEQVMQICRELAGFSLAQADNVRRAMSKKKHKVMEQERIHFVHGNTTPGQECKGCVANGISEAIANEIFDDMVSFASYAFNKSHAACYAYVAYQTAFLKCHYPSEFMAALLTSVQDNTSKVIEYTTECQRLGIQLLPPNINISAGGFTVDGKNIRFGLNAVKNVGRNLIAAVVRERQDKPFASLYDFCKRMYGNEINRRAIESLIKCGAFDELGATRNTLLQNIEGVLKSVETSSRKNLEGQLDLFGFASGEEDADTYQMKPLVEFPVGELLLMEKEVSGLYLSGHPLDAYRERIKEIDACRIIDLVGEEARQYDGKNVCIVCTVIKSKFMTTRSNTMMAFTNVEDLSGGMEILIFPKVLTDYRQYLQENAVVVISGRVSVKEEEAPKLIADSVDPIDTYKPRSAKAAYQRQGSYTPKPAPMQPTSAQPPAPKPQSSRSGLYLKLPSKQCPEFDKVVNLLSIFGGDVPVYMYFADENQLTLAPKSMFALQNARLQSELQRILGEKNVVYK